MCVAPRVENVQLAIQHIWPLVYQYRMDNADTTTVVDPQMFVMPGNNTRVSIYKKKRPSSKRTVRKIHYYVEDSDGEVWSDTTDEELDSEEERQLMIDEEEATY